MNSLEKPKEYHRALELIDQLDKIGCDTSSFREKIVQGRYGWDVSLKEVSTSELNRCSQILTGPLFTSKKYPWPEENGIPFVPGFQLDLGNIKKRTGIDLGGHDEILQVWASQKDTCAWEPLIRLIPKREVRKDRLVVAPGAEMFNPPLDSHVFPLDWTKHNGVAVQITRYDASPDFMIDGMDEGSFVESFDEDEKKRRTKKQTLIRELKELTVDGWWHSPPLDFCLFGTFHPIQYDPPKNEADLTVVFCFDRGYGYRWGDGGNAQLYYRKSNDKFSLDWSCY